MVGAVCRAGAGRLRVGLAHGVLELHRSPRSVGRCCVESEPKSSLTWLEELASPPRVLEEAVINPFLAGAGRKPKLALLRTTPDPFPGAVCNCIFSNGR